jgi:2-polyprenyl-3-methyl-5-hydroxy-6-metoxy-1,4-benzoquinol methylase
MNSVFEKNLQAVKDHMPTLAEALADCSESSDSLHRIFGKQIPELEADAEKWLGDYLEDNNQLIIVAGFGTGLKLRGVLARMSEKQKMIVYEPRPGRIHAAMQIFDLADLFESPNVRIYSGAPSLTLFKNDVKETISGLVAESVDTCDEKSFEYNVTRLIADISSTVELKHYERILEETVNEARDRVLNDVLSHRVNDAAVEIAEFLGMDAGVVATGIVHSTNLIADDWKKARPETPEEIHDWYEKTPYYIFDLAAYHLVSAGYARTIELIEDKLGGVSGPVLDFGGGDGDMTIRLAGLGLDVTYCDVPGRTMKYAQWRFQRNKLNIRVIESISPHTIDLDRQYAAILALDVLEHLVNPIIFCEIFFKNLEPGGVLIAKPSFSDAPDLFPMHLKSNVRYANSFDSEMERIGFRKLPPEDDAVGFWEKPEQ